ncbi:hypothetical protein TNCV_575601 [Trichonephila clavipes]|nr:hypothetical protein TNCV_575601 [Trichonephila clavipes]
MMLWGVTPIKEGFNRFKTGRMPVESDQRSGPQTALNAAIIQKVENLVMKDRLLAVRETAEQVGISIGSRHEFCVIMRRAAAKFVSQLLLVELKNSVW